MLLLEWSHLIRSGHWICTYIICLKLTVDPKQLNNMNVKGQKKSCHYLLVVQLESPNKIVYNAISSPNNTCFNN